MGSAKDAALLAAVSAGEVDRIAVLLEEGANPRARQHGWSALHLAAHAGRTQAAALLLDAGADIDEVMVTDELIDRTRYEGSATPLIISLRERHEDFALFLLKSGAKVEHQDAFSGENALFLAAKHGFDSVVERVLARGPAGECKIFGETTPLEAAAAGGHIAIVRLLLAAGVSVTARSFCAACRRGSLELVTLLIDSGAVVNVESDDSPLMAAAGSGHVAVIERLLSWGADLQRQGARALHNAAGAGHTQAALFLIQRGIDVNSRDRHGWTPLMSAAWQGKRETTQALLDAGADPTLTDGAGKTALDWARESHRKDAVPVLQ